MSLRPTTDYFWFPRDSAMIREKRETNQSLFALPFFDDFLRRLDSEAHERHHLRQLVPVATGGVCRASE